MELRSTILYRVCKQYCIIRGLAHTITTLVKERNPSTLFMSLIISHQICRDCKEEEGSYGYYLVADKKEKFQGSEVKAVTRDSADILDKFMPL